MPRLWKYEWHIDAGAILSRLLLGVGKNPDYWDRGELAIHLRRNLNAAELSRLDQQWIAIPAIDEA